jgi:hypothetical protein
MPKLNEKGNNIRQILSNWEKTWRNTIDTIKASLSNSKIGNSTKSDER